LNEEYYFDLAAAYERAGDLEKSMALFAQIIKEHPNHHPSLNYLAYMWAERAENLDSALDYVKRALVLDPENGAYLDTLGWIYYQQQAYKAAYRELLRAAEVIPDDPVVTEHLGDVLMQLGRPWEARAYYRISLSLDPAERTEIVQNALEKADRAVSESLSGRKISP
jgi:tetratricopeptide (TPR) repeat protein